MASTYDVTDPKTGKIFRYSSISYWDKDKKAPRSKNEYLGRVDPVTGELIPKKARKKKEAADLPVEAPAECIMDASQYEERIRILEARVKELEEERSEMKDKLMALADSLA